MNKKAAAFSLVLACTSLAPVSGGADPIYGESVRLARGGTKGMIVADDGQAAEWGAEILRRGGNAIDAAVATAFAMSVTRPQYASLGGGGFMVFCPAPKNGKASACTTLDFREKAPTAATRDMYIRNGKAETALSQNGALASGVPGVPAGILRALEEFGTRPRKELLSKPIRMAREGVRFGTGAERAALERWKIMNPEARRVFGCGHEDKPCFTGELLRQPDLATVLEAISRKGASGFYRGEVARKLVDGVRAAGGVLTLKDLEQYAPSARKPLRGEYQGYEVITMPPPSSGGVALLQLLGFMKKAEQSGELKDGYGSIRAIHAETHAMSLAFADRAEHLGDMDFYPVPLERMLSEAYLGARWGEFNPRKAALPKSAGAIPREPQHTTHFSVIDKSGNAVAITETINDNFGSGFVPPGTGVVMNDEMDDFSAQPGVPNLFGLVGGEANSIAPGKRPLSSMTPTIVRDKNGTSRIVIGAAGGPRIITAVFQSLLNRMRFGMSLIDAVSSPRFHQQWKPAKIRMERNGFPFETRERLKDMGYEIEIANGLGVVHALERLENGRVVGAPDPRGEGSVAAE